MSGECYISQKPAPLIRRAGFRSIILDDRKEPADREGAERAGKRTARDLFEQVRVDDMEINEVSCPLVVTGCHAHDRIVLRRAFGTKADTSA